MDKKKAGKATSIVISIIVICLTWQSVNWEVVGIYLGCGLTCRALYPFYHVNLLHALLNVWCLLSVVFIYDTSLWRLVFAYVIALSVPSLLISTTPTVGLSGVVFALFGSISFEVERKTYYQLWMSAYLVVGFLFPNTNAWIHLYCYIAGLLAALLNKPVRLG